MQLFQRIWAHNINNALIHMGQHSFRVAIGIQQRLPVLPGQLMGAMQGDPIDLLMGIGTHKPLRILFFYETERVFLKKNTSTFRGHVIILFFELQSLCKKLSI